MWLQYNLVSVLMLAMLLVKVVALVISFLYPDEAYRAADKLTKVAWCAILGVGVGLDLIGGGLFGIIFFIAACVFLVDVRPALKDITGRR